MSSENFQFIKPGEVRTRFAPAPTGFLHIGSARTALFNYLFAQKNQGSFILRIEDTDIERSKPKFEKDILENLKWLGIEWTEGPGRAGAGLKIKNYIGEYGPYRQSERLDIYAKYLKKLLAENKAYYCFCLPEEIEDQRQYTLSQGQSWHYNGKCAQLSPKEIKKYLAEKKSSVIRFKMPAKKVKFDDLIRGKVEFDTSLIGDITIAKDLNTPLYNFTVVIDDFEMKISHVIRGEDHLSNTPKQILIQETLGFPMLKYAHSPLILGPDRAKLSKRHGAISVAQYRKAGYLPEALINFIAFLGWNPGTEREIFALPSLIKDFTLEGVQKGGAVFNQKRLDFLNGFYLRQKSIEKLTELCLPYLVEARLISPAFRVKPRTRSLAAGARSDKELTQTYRILETGEEVSFDSLKKIVSIYQERLKKLSEISQLADFFFKKKIEYNKDLLKWKDMTEKETAASLDKLEKILYKIEEGNFSKEVLEKILVLQAEEFGKKIKKTGPALQQAGYEVKDRGYLLWPLRVALTGKEATAGPFEIAEILGKQKVLERLENAKKLLKL